MIRRIVKKNMRGPYAGSGSRPGRERPVQLGRPDTARPPGGAPGGRGCVQVVRSACVQVLRGAVLISRSAGHCTVHVSEFQSGPAWVELSSTPEMVLW